MTHPTHLRSTSPRLGSPVLDVRSVSKRFTLHLRDGLQLPVLADVSLQVQPGECVALSGASGRGKSTLMKCLFGSYGVDAGQMWLDTGEGQRTDLAQASAAAVRRLRQRDIAYVTQFLRALPRRAAVDVVADRLLEADVGMAAALAADPLDDRPYQAARDAARERAGQLLARLNLPRSLWGLPPATFSGGEQQRVNIARGLVQAARLLLLDEPTASLDAANRRVVIELIHEAKAAGTAVVGIFHDEEVRDAVADRCLDFGALAPPHETMPSAATKAPLPHPEHTPGSPA